MDGGLGYCIEASDQEHPQEKEWGQVFLSSNPRCLTVELNH